MKKNNKFEITTLVSMDVLDTNLMSQVLGGTGRGDCLQFSCDDFVCFKNCNNATCSILCSSKCSGFSCSDNCNNFHQ